MWRRLTTAWGPRGDPCINGFAANLRAAELASALEPAAKTAPKADRSA